MNVSFFLFFRQRFFSKGYVFKNETWRKVNMLNKIINLSPNLFDKYFSGNAYGDLQSGT
jgi:hypothetical protein